MGERLEPRAEPRGGPAHALGDRAHPPVLAGQQRDDAVGLAQLVGAQHDRLVAVERHLRHSAPASRQAAVRTGVSARVPASGAAPAPRGLPAAEREADRRPVEPVGRDPPLQDAVGPHERRVAASPRPASRRRRPGGSGRPGGPRPAPAPGSPRRCLDDGAIRPKKSPCTTAATDSARWSRVSSADPRPERHQPARDRPGQPAAAPLTVNGRKRAANSSGAKARIPASRALSSTGISTIRPAHPLGRDHRDLERDVGAQRRAADRPPASAPRWSSSATTCSPKAVIE